MREPLTIVTPVYEDTEASSRLLLELAKEFGDAVHVVVVDDGSVREPIDIKHLERAGVSGDLIHLKRNIGHQRAIVVGLSYVAERLPEDRCVIMDSDGEDVPSTIHYLLTALGRDQVDIAVAERRSRVETLRFRIFYFIYKAIFGVLTGRRINFGNFMALNPRAVKRLVSMEETWTHVAGATLASKLRLEACPLDRGARYAGKSKMNFTGLALHGFKALMVFAEDVLVRVGMMCVLISMVAVMCAFIAIVLKVVGFATPGWFSVALGVLFLVFLQTAALTLMTLMLSGVTKGAASPLATYERYIEKVVHAKTAKGTGRLTAIPLQFVRHVLNGLFATGIHFGTLSFNLFVLQMESAGLANLIAAVVGTCASFVGNRYFVFRASSESSVRQAVAFGILYGLIALLHGATLYVWTDVNGLDYRLGFILATGAQVMISYVGNKTWVFKTG